MEADGDVKWESPWGPGRPGWHIECSVMSMAHLGESFDLHCGGEDLVFPHHEDEIAQSEAATGKPFVKYWLHNAHLLVEGKKMSKSLGNFFTLRDLLAKGWTGREVRYVLLSAHYREPLNFTMDGLTAARSALQRLDDLLLRLQGIVQSDESIWKGVFPTVERLHAEIVNRRLADMVALVDGFESSLDDDLNISPALSAFFDFVRATNKRDVSREEASVILSAWDKLDEVLGLGMPKRSDVPA